jgi:hypothetical protein
LLAKAVGIGAVCRMASQSGGANFFIQQGAVPFALAFFA